MISRERIDDLRAIRRSVLNPSAAKMLDDLLAAIDERDSEIERLRAEEDGEGREIGQLHDALEAYRNELATARAALEKVVYELTRGFGSPSALEHARKALEEIK